MAREVALSKGMVAVVDDEDYEVVAKYNWFASFRTFAKSRRSCYAVHYKKNPRQCIYMHRLILGAKKGQCVDHVDHDGLNNRRSNLRVCDHSQNGGNAITRVGYTSKHKGVCWNRQIGKWTAYIKCKGKHKYLGRFDSEEDAALAYKNAAASFFGEFANA